LTLLAYNSHGFVANIPCGGASSWRRYDRACLRIVVPARAASSSRAAPPPGRTATSTASWRRSTSGSAGSSSPSWPESRAAAPSHDSRASPASAATPSAGAYASWDSGPRRRAGPAAPGAGAGGAEKAGRPPPGPGGAVAGRRRRRPHHRAEGDPQIDAPPQPGPAPAGLPRLAQHRGPAASGARLPPALLPQALGGGRASRPRPAVPLPGPPAAAVPGPRLAGDQPGHQEEGTGGAVPEPRPVLAPPPAPRVRPRLPQLGRRAGHPLRHLRPRPRRRLRGGRHVARYPEVRGRRHPPVVAGGGAAALPPGAAAADRGGQRRLQRLPQVGVEGGAAGAGGRGRAGHRRDALAAGGLEVEPGRSPDVQPDQRQLGGGAPDELRGGVEIPPGDPVGGRFPLPRLAGPKGLPPGPARRAAGEGPRPAAAAEGPAPVELRHPTT